MNIAIKNYRPFEKNTLLAFLDLEIVDLGLELRGCTLHSKAGSRWIGFPGRPYKDKEGRETWANIINIEDKVHRREFQSAALAALEQHLTGKEATADGSYGTSEFPF